MKNLTDEELVSAYIHTHQSAYFGLIYKRYYKKVYAHCLGFTSVTTQAEDLAHDVFERVLHKLTTFKGNARFSTWLYIVCRNYCLSQYQQEQQRSRAATAFEQARESIVVPDGVSGLDQQLARLDFALREISDDDRQLLLTRYGAGLSINQLATDVQVSPSAVKMRLWRARERLREALQ